MNPHADVGAYLLGALDDDEMSRFEEHLASCDDCGRELDELSGVVPVLAELRSDGIGYVEPPGDALLARLLAQVAGERGRRKRRRLLSVAAAAVLVVGGPAVAVVATHDGGSSPAAVATAPAAWQQATDPVTGVWAAVAATDTRWGTSIDVRVSGVSGPHICYLEAISKAGGRPQTASTWSVPPGGYGTVPLTVSGATGLKKDDIARYEIRDDKGKLLVSIPGDAAQPADRPRSSD